MTGIRPHSSSTSCETPAPPRSMEARQRAQQQSEAGPGTAPAELAERRREAQGCLQTLSRHSYWFDIWIFLLFDLVLLVFVFLLP